MVQVKGLDLPGHDPRAFVSIAINYATGPRGSCHLRRFVLHDYSIIPELGIPETADIYSVKNPTILSARYQDRAELFNSFVQCEYMTAGGLRLDNQIELLNYVPRRNVNAVKMLKIAERIFTLQRVINISWGMGRKDDALPPKMFELLKKGVSAEKTAHFEKLLRDYCELRGWDSNGKPTAGKLVDLNLTERAQIETKQKPRLHRNHHK